MQKQAIEYKVKIPLITIDKYEKLLKNILEKENPLFVTVLKSGVNDYATSQSRQNRIPKTGLTVKEYKISESNPVKISSFFLFPNTRHQIGPNISIISHCDLEGNKNNVFCLPEQILTSRSLISLDLTQESTWNIKNPTIEKILGVNIPSSPPQSPLIYVYILFLLQTPDEKNGMDVELAEIPTELFEAYVIILHKKMIENLL
jgi:hypothetical protein